MESPTLVLKNLHNFDSVISTIQKRDDFQFPFASLSKITSEDKELLHSAVLHTRPYSKNYEDSWGYIIQATRYDGFKWHDPFTGSLIFFGRKAKNSSTLIVASYFADPEYFSYVLGKIKSSFKTPKIIVKNVNTDEITKLLSYGFRQYEKNEAWCSSARFDDQTFPQQLVDLKRLVITKGRKYHELRQDLNKKPNISIRNYIQTDYNDVLNLFVLKDKNLKTNEIKEEGMYYASHRMYPRANIDKFVIVENTTNKIIGFTATSDISSLYTTLVASIFKFSVKTESAWGIYNTLLIKYQQGFQIANLGGCETLGTFNFLKRRFRPYEKIKKTHLVYDKEL